MGGKKLGEKSLDEFIASYDSEIKEHRKITNNFLYVNNFSGWNNPKLSFPNINTLEKNIKGKILALHSIYEFLTKKYDKGYSQTDNFHFYKDKNGNVTIQFDQT